MVLLVVLVAAPSLVAADPDDGTDDGGSGPIGKPSDTRTVGWVLVPTPDAARGFTPMQAQGLVVSYVTVTPRAAFTLDSTDATGSGTCLVGVCAATGDFDIVFFQEQSDGSTRVTGRYSGVGVESGDVPSESDFAFVYLKTPGTNPTLRGFEYVYTETLPRGNGGG